MNHRQEIAEFLRAALECTIYLAPTDLWLTYDEIIEIGTNAGYLKGEIGDAIPEITTPYFGQDKRLKPNEHNRHLWGIFVWRQNPDYRNYKALDLIVSELNQALREVGAANARMERATLVERAMAQNITRLDAQAAITLLVFSNTLNEKDGVVWLKAGQLYEPLPSVQRESASGGAMTSDARTRAYPIVKDIIERRSDGRASKIESLDAFGDGLAQLGYTEFRAWWSLTVSELRRTDPQISPVSTLVLAAALVEGALTFVVRFARERNVGPFRTSDFDKDPRSWKIDDLVKSATTGGEHAVFDSVIKARVDTIIRNRQRIHAGRMLSEYPRGVPELRPEQARDAKSVAEAAVRSVLDWLQKHQS
jgi:hypothetical protein